MRQNQSLRIRTEDDARDEHRESAAELIDVTEEDVVVADDDDGLTSKLTEDAKERVAEAHTPYFGSVYEAGDDVDVTRFEDNYTFPRFIEAVLKELGKDFAIDDARLFDDIANPVDVDFGFLLVYPDDSLMFVGSDPTAKDAVPWFSFVIERHEPMPAPGSAQGALDLLKPPSVQDALHEDDYLPDRHGEWWLLPTTLIPGGTVFEPGVQDKPMGPSPLGNHVPREYAFTVSDKEFMQRFRDGVDAPSTIASPPEAIEWTWRQIRRPSTNDDAPGWADVREWAGDVLVRGTIRHRDDDHFVENCEQRWHVAETHDVEVYTGDGIAERVHLDYHGR